MLKILCIFLCALCALQKKSPCTYHIVHCSYKASIYLITHVRMNNNQILLLLIVVHCCAVGFKLNRRAVGTTLSAKYVKNLNSKIDKSVSEEGYKCYVLIVFGSIIIKF